MTVQVSDRTIFGLSDSPIVFSFFSQPIAFPHKRVSPKSQKDPHTYTRVGVCGSAAALCYRHILVYTRKRCMTTVDIENDTKQRACGGRVYSRRRGPHAHTPPHAQCSTLCGQRIIALVTACSFVDGVFIPAGYGPITNGENCLSVYTHIYTCHTHAHTRTRTRYIYIIRLQPTEPIRQRRRWDTVSVAAALEVQRRRRWSEDVGGEKQDARTYTQQEYNSHISPASPTTIIYVVYGGIYYCRKLQCVPAHAARAYYTQVYMDPDFQSVNVLVFRILFHIYIQICIQNVCLSIACARGYRLQRSKQQRVR